MKSDTMENSNENKDDLDQVVSSRKVKELGIKQRLQEKMDEQGFFYGAKELLVHYRNF